MKNLLWKLAAVLLATCAPVAYSADAPAPGGGSDGAGKTLVPGKGWTCGMAGGIPVPERGAPVFEATLLIDKIYDVGTTPFGRRKVIVFQGGIFKGEKIGGTVMPGGLDFQLGFSNGALEIEQVLVLKTDDGKFLYLRCAGTAADERDVRMVPDFEAPVASAHNWLNAGKFAGRRILDPAGKTVKLSFFEVSKVTVATAPEAVLQVIKPSDVADQPWEYRVAEAGEKPGDPLIVETVTIGGGQSVGATKNGGRNIIPITGGTLTGKITGRVLSGGADYQRLADPVTLDARYLWQTEDGDVIIVRNAGPLSKLVPVFEARVDGKYAWLNKGRYLSSGPAVSDKGVSLTFSESAP